MALGWTVLYKIIFKHKIENTFFVKQTESIFYNKNEQSYIKGLFKYHGYQKKTVYILDTVILEFILYSKLYYKHFYILF